MVMSSTHVVAGVCCCHQQCGETEEPASFWFYCFNTLLMQLLQMTAAGVTVVLRLYSVSPLRLLGCTKPSGACSVRRADLLLLL